MLRWYPGVLLRVVLWLTFVPILFSSILVVNCVSDRATPWSIGVLSGPGVSPDFWKLAGLVALGWTLLALGWRGARTVFKVLIVAWHTGFTAAFVSFVSDPGDFFLRGESVDLSVSLELLGPVFSLTALVCSVVWIALDLRLGSRDRTVSPMQRRNKLAACLGSVALLAAGFAFGSDFEELGAGLCAFACLAWHEAIRPVNPSEELRKALLLEGSAPH